MPRQTYIFCPVRKQMIPKEEFHAAEPQSTGAPAVFGDNESFVSPLDGKQYNGRAGMREHNKRHDVVSHRDLVGLPYYQTNSDVRGVQEKRRDAAARKELIIHQVNQKVR